MGSKLFGVSKVRRLMRRAPEEVQREIISALTKTGGAIAPAMRGRVRRRSGNLQGGISFKVFPKTMRLQVGILGRRQRTRLFYGRIVDVGRKGQTVTARRHNKNGSVTTYTMNVKAMRGQHFISGSYRDMRTTFTRNVNGIWDRALAKLSGGGE
jgi:hypothetical protein